MKKANSGCSTVMGTKENSECMTLSGPVFFRFFHVSCVLNEILNFFTTFNGLFKTYLYIYI